MFVYISGNGVLTLYVMSDSYLGLDQQYDIPLKIIEASLEAQVNSEVIINEVEEEREKKWHPPPSDTVPTMVPPCEGFETGSSYDPQNDSGSQDNSDSWPIENKARNGKQQRTRNKERKRDNAKGQTWGSSEEVKGAW
nr:uncharacterized protein LOC123748853 [Procambarus clarkii]XP_045589123.1 uncharacterized protein LOC123751067 [Procambarus clarkii]